MTVSKAIQIQWVILVSGLALCLLPLSGRTQDAGNIVAQKTPHGVNYEAKGNLAVTHVLKCRRIAEMKTDYTPADIYPAFADCVSKERYNDASQLFVLAGVYGSFDTLRVTDVSAHQARAVLIMQTMATLAPAQKEAWVKEFTAYTGTEEGHIQLCSSIRSVGPPTYYPTYMIQHGMDAFAPQRPAPLVEPFDAAAAWQSTLTSYMQCPL